MYDICDFFNRFCFQVAEEIWICENGTVTKWEGGILKYKDHLKSKILKENADNAAKIRK
jgi:ATP-binding cassette, subfamily F, member 2